MNYQTLKNINEEISFIVLLKFLGDLKNANVCPATKAASEQLNLPPIVFWWYEHITPEAMHVIVNAINDFKWQDPWVVQEVGNKRVFLPKKITDIETTRNLTTHEACDWLYTNDPDFGQRANADLKLFAKFFRGKVEEYLKAQESKNST